MVLIGGLITSTLLTLVFIPAMYTIFDDLEQLVAGLAQRLSKPRPFSAEELAVLHPSLVPHLNGVAPAGVGATELLGPSQSLAPLVVDVDLPSPDALLERSGPRPLAEPEGKPEGEPV